MAMGIPAMPGPLGMQMPPQMPIFSMTPQMMPNTTPLGRMNSTGDSAGSDPRNLPNSPVPPNMPRDSLED